MISVAGLPLAQAIQIPLPVPGTRYCRVTDVVNAGSPPRARVTVDDIAACGITPENNLIAIGGVLNTNIEAKDNKSALNVHVDGPEDTAGLSRRALNIAGNSFDVFKGDGVSPVANNGRWSVGGMVWRVNLMDLKEGPLIFADGKDGVITKGLQSTDEKSGWASAASLTWQAMMANSDAYLAAGVTALSDRNLGNTLTAALRWYGEGKPATSAYREAAITGLENIAQYWPTTACGFNLRKCGHADSSVSDYKVSLYGFQAVAAASFMWDELSPETRLKIRNFFLNDYPWTKGGHGFPNARLTIPGWKPSPGKITYNFESNIVTGEGTKFTAFQPGDVIYLPSPELSVYAEMYVIAQIDSDTQLRLTTTPNTNAGVAMSNVPFRVAPGWASDHPGVLWQSKFYYAHATCGVNYFQTAAHGCKDYTTAAFDGGGQDIAANNNHAAGHIAFDIVLGTAFANYDLRAAALLVEAAGIFVHRRVPELLSTISGIGAASTNGYAPARTGYATLVALGTLKTAVVQAPDYGHETFYRSMANWALAQKLPGRDQLLMSQYLAFDIDPYSVGNQMTGFALMLYRPEMPEAAQIKAWLPRWKNWTITGMARDRSYQNMAYLGTRGDLEPVERKNTSMLMAKSLDVCLERYGPEDCRDRARAAIVSRTGWGEDALSVFWNVNGHSREDSTYQVHEVGTYLAMNGRLLLYPDSGGPNHPYYGGSGDQFNTISIAGSPFKTTAMAATNVLAMAGNEFYAAGRADISDHYAAPPGGRILRSMIHAKRGPADFVMERLDTPVPAAARFHYFLEDCGTPSQSTCVAFSSADRTVSNTQPGAKLMTQFVLGTPATESRSDTNGSYAGSGGKTFLVKLAGSGTLLAVHRATSEAGEAMPPITHLSAGAWQGVQIDGSSPKLLLAAGEACQPGASFNATHSAGAAQLVLTGLCPGTTYTVKRNGSGVEGCTEIEVRLGEEAFECGAVESGAIEVATSNGAPPPAIQRRANPLARSGGAASLVAAKKQPPAQAAAPTPPPPAAVVKPAPSAAQPKKPAPAMKKALRKSAPAAARPVQPSVK